MGGEVLGKKIVLISSHPHSHSLSQEMSRKYNINNKKDMNAGDVEEVDVKKAEREQEEAVIILLCVVLPVVSLQLLIGSFLFWGFKASILSHTLYLSHKRYV